MAAKETFWEFIRETGSKKYFLVKKKEDEYFVFRSPKLSGVTSKLNHTLENWEGEIVPWGGVPAKIRKWLLRKKVTPDPKKQEVLIHST